ncbi:hypothetical protein HG530_009517 [Fusarium avenaceum]|nr:hypothetical protein HG530_009517 [Fusarium avenaceum]
MAIALWLQSNLLALNATNDLLRRILGNDLIVMQHLELLSRVAAHEVQDGLYTTRVLIEPVAKVHDDTLDNNPDIALGVVLGNLLHCELLLGNLEGLGRDLANTLGCAADTTLEGILEEVVAGSITSNTAVDNTAEKRRTTQTVGTVDTTGQLTTGVETLERLLLLVENLSLVVDLNTTHGEVENGLHDSDVEVIIDVKGQVVEELLAPRVLLLAIGNRVVGSESLLEVLGGASNLLGKLLTGHLLHETTTRVVTGVEVKDLGGLGVKNESDGELVLLLLIPHHTRDVITVTKLITESVTIGVEEKTTLTTESLSSQELPLGARVLGVDETCRVDLDLVHVNTVTTNGHDHLLAITSSVCAVCGGEAVATGSKDDGAAEVNDLAVVLVLDTSDLVTLLVKLGDAGLLDDLDAAGFAFGKLLEALHQGVGDGHTRELGIVSSVGGKLNIPETRDEGEVEVELVLEPLNGGGGLVSQDLDEVRTSLVTGRLEGIIVKLLDAIGDASVNLRPCESTVDTRGSLGRVSTEKACKGRTCQQMSYDG